MLPLLTSDPREIGPYRLVGRLGSGGMGVVYAGVDVAGRRAAVKLVHEVLSVDVEFRRRFSREIFLVGEIDGACIARILHSDPGTERPWLASEYIAGPTLEQHMNAEGPLSADALYGLAAGLAEALVAVHAADVVHRDLKPSNVILSPEGPRLIDFGIAKALDGTSMTRTGQLVGSPGWISPEEYGEGPSGTPADVYGWAMLVLFAATAEHPYGSGRPEVLAYRVREEIPETDAVPEGLRELVRRALSKDPAERPLAAELLAAVLEAWPGGTAEAEPVADATALIQRTWVMQPHESPDWSPAAIEEVTSPRTSRSASVADLIAAGAAVAAGPMTTPPPVSPPPAPPAPVVARRPAWVLAYVATAVAVTLIAVTAIVSFAPRATTETPTEAKAQVKGPAPTPAVTATATVTATPSLAAPSKKPRFKGEPVSFKGITMTLPKGWRMIKVREDLVCLESPRSRGSSGPWEFACRPDAMVVKTGSGDKSWPGDSIEDTRWGWFINNPMPCLRDGRTWRDPEGTYDIYTGEYGLYERADEEGARLSYSGLAKMADGRKAYYRNWRIPCWNHGSYTMKIWHLPQSKVSFFVLGAHDADAKGYRQIIASTDLTGYKHAVPA
ncbi:serine/threonine protein kinase [Nonomuraea sp. NN258]|uniref:serine/threonine protein kinase n=1 Tax=Nonomuraea antri TaxID=2730852 RepID=UPI0015687EF9|nr:serine/threonine-protein kinase [Nonomuraea antri]NRQ40107.1 serine/threonine protein kinase [Nonomuraea antri]